jgi:hypothetical protein
LPNIPAAILKEYLADAGAKIDDMEMRGNNRDVGRDRYREAVVARTAGSYRPNHSEICQDLETPCLVVSNLLVSDVAGS